MNSKERVRTALRRREPDRMPVFANFVPEKKRELLAHFGTDDFYEMTIALGSDMVMAGGGIELSFYGPEEEYVCEWGCTWRYFQNRAGRYTEIVRHPLQDDPDGRKLEAFRIPDPVADKVAAPVRALVEKYGRDYFICQSLACSIFEAGWYLHGLEDTMMDMAANPDYAHALFDKTMQFPLQAGLRAIREGCDMVWLGDDVGMQDRMMMSPETWRTFLKPRLAAIIRAFHEENPEVLVAYHSCGYIEPIIEDLIEIGLDVLNPIQPLAMDPARIKEAYGDRLAFWGGICVQKTLPLGTEQDIRDEVALRMRTIGKGGGYLMSPAHNIQADTSLANILAFFRAAKELGIYY
ncbi:MAG: uroporphyrinogen decarboxylase family protein [Clostridiales Family XIII bacterium]|jgi:uroporphyrinogen decarboxylase|nr:uroporphyrinogen decarboxylase family protein [Clostridiales Family XIII bacterium]